MSLNHFLKKRGVSPTIAPSATNDAYLSEAQKVQFSEQLPSHIRTIAEIGFNAGHSAEHFFLRCPQLQLLAAFDLNAYPCTPHATDYFYQTYPNRFVFIPGDSLSTLPDFHQRYPKVKFDLIYIDGCHQFEWACADLWNGRHLAHENTLVWIDDVEPDFQNPVGAAVQFHERLGRLTVEKCFSSDDPLSGKRHWVQAKYAV